jgi:hypothetical protein
MQYLMLVCTDPEAEPDGGQSEDIAPWFEKYSANGWRVEGDRLRPGSDAVTVRRRGGKVFTSDGPFAESKEGIAGYDLLNCPDLDAALEVAAAHPMSRFGRIEIRPIDALNLPGMPGLAPVPPGTSLFFQFIVDTPDGEPYVPAENDIESWVDKHLRSGALRGGERLAGRQSATTVRRRGGRLLVTDGPFADTKESLAGYGILACRTLDEAVRISADHPGARYGCVEVRAFWPFG